MWLWLVATALGSDLSVTQVGGQGVHAQTIGAQSMDLLVGQRLRWEVADHTRTLLDARLLVDPTAALGWEESRLREAGLAHETERLTLLVGRHPVMSAPRRLTDGVQVAAHPGAASQWTLGAWAGLVPDEFTTAPTLRFGGGPVLGWTTPAASASLVGDLVWAPEGLQRLAALAQGRGELGSRLEVGSRLDVLLQDSEGRRGLADGAVTLQADPVDGLRLEGLYNAYSSLLYQSRASLDPRVRRFAARIEQLGLTGGLTQDELDPTLHHLLGTSARLAGRGSPRPQLQLGARTQLHADPTERYTRLSAAAGLGGLLDDRLELTVSGHALWIDGEPGGEAGLALLIEPLPDAMVAIDTSASVLFDPVDFQGAPGAYADLFVDVASRGGTTLSAGGSWTAEPSDVVGTDVGLAAFVRLQQWIRPRRGASSERP
jgi:hypothetical protein